MAQKIGDFYWEIDADTSKFDRGAKKTEKDVTGLGKSFTGLGKIVTTAFVATAVLGIAKVSKQLILAASDAEETQNKFNVVFSSISDSAEDAAANLSENFGLSSNAARTLLSDTGDLLTGFGFTQESALNLSDQVNQLAVDLASFTNFSGGAEGASQALTKALLGERESVKALGISILETDVQAKVLELSQQGLTFETERQAKAFATLKIAQDQSKNAIGDFARSSDSFANQQRIATAAVDDLKSALGVGLLPIATDTVRAFGNMTAALADFIEERNKLAAEKSNFELAAQGRGDAIKAYNDQLNLINRVKDARENDRVELMKLAREYDFNIRKLDEWIMLQENDLKVKKRNADFQQSVIDGREAEAAAIQEEIDAEEDRLSAVQEYIAFIEGEYSGTSQAKLEQLQEELSLIEANIDSYGGLREEQEILIELKKAQIEQLEEELGIREEVSNTIEEGVRRRMALREEERNLDELTADALEERNQRIAESEELLYQQRLAAATSFFGGFSSLLAIAGKESRAAAVASKVLSAAEAGINTGVAFTKTLADGGPYPLNLINAAGILAAGLAQQIQIAQTPIPSFEVGGIVPGTSFTGDNVRANVNSGEMILTRNDQENLLKQIRTGNTGAQSIVLQLPDNTSVKWVVDGINSGRGGIIQGRVVK